MTDRQNPMAGPRRVGALAAAATVGALTLLWGVDNVQASTPPTTNPPPTVTVPSPPTTNPPPTVTVPAPPTTMPAPTTTVVDMPPRARAIVAEPPYTG